MSIKQRVDDALVLWNAGHKEGAWVLALIAAAATSRKRYPGMTDNKAFKAFIRDILPTLVYGRPSVGEQPRLLFGDVWLEDIIYNDMRCHLIHEGNINSSVILTESTIVDGELRATMRVGNPRPHEFPDFWVLHLLKAVKEAPENDELFNK